eukprot:TRINITY_DN2036_c0_g1_i5.p1 TRINITY_DN2036_c0_g1~~TRINITY_DN2036_c0_g1_i5.p1  ORF type:complete len:308 (+),score=31.84 TRINITY_DN2036_c0_g1_i5:404-1327(+)
MKPPRQQITVGVSRIWWRLVKEVREELPIFYKKWPIIIGGVIFQYLHGVASKTAHFLHTPAPVLHDMGFELLPEIGKERAYLSELAFAFIFVPFFLWTFHPFVFRMKRIFTVLIWTKVLTVLCICQFLRVISFTATQLPGPNYHCRLGSPIATLPPPKSLADIFLLNLTKSTVLGCGDLIFSSHMTFALVSLLEFSSYGSKTVVKFIGWTAAVVQSLLIISARKHYTVDVVIAWYVVPLVYYFVHNQLSSFTGHSEHQERSSDSDYLAASFRSTADSDDEITFLQVLIDTRGSTSNGQQSPPKQQAV